MQRVELPPPCVEGGVTPSMGRGGFTPPIPSPYVPLSPQGVLVERFCLHPGIGAVCCVSPCDHRLVMCSKALCVDVHM